MRSRRGSRSRGEALLFRRLRAASRAYVASGCAFSIAVVFAVETVTPDAVVSSMTLLPLLVGCWVLPPRWSFALCGLATALFALAAAVEPAGRVTLIFVAIPTLAVAFIVRNEANRMKRMLIPPVATKEFGLTRREREVAGLAAQAYTAAEIGRQLHIGERTVESHLASAYGKLGIRSKHELIRLGPKVGLM